MDTTKNTPSNTPPDFEYLAKDYLEDCWDEIIAYASNLAETVGREIINPDHIRDALVENITVTVYEAHRLESADDTPTEIWPENYYDPLEQAVADQIDGNLETILAEAYKVLEENSEEIWERHCEYNEMTLPKP